MKSNVTLLGKCSRCIYPVCWYPNSRARPIAISGK